MSEQGDARPQAPVEASEHERPQGLRGWLVAGLTALSIRGFLFGLLLLALVVSIPFGGMRAAAKPSLAVLKKDKPVTATPFTITYKGAWQTADVGEGVSDAPKLKDGSRYLMVGAYVRASGDKSVPKDVLEGAVRLVGVRGLASSSLDPTVVTNSLDVDPDVMLVDADYHSMGSMPPGLSYGLYWIWILAPGQTVPEDLKVRVVSTTYRKSSLDEQYGYFDPVPAAQGTFPVATWQPLVSTPVDVQGAG